MSAFAEGDRVSFPGRDLRSGEVSVVLEGVVQSVRGAHVRVLVGGAGLMVVAASACTLVRRPARC